MTSAKQSITFQIEKPELLQRLATSANKQAVPYKVVSELRSVSGEDKVEINTSNAGTLDLSALASAK